MSQELQPTFQIETGAGLMLAGGESFAHIQRVAKMFASSNLVPKEFQNNAANCTIALEMAHRMSANPMAVMQNLFIVHGKPGWSAQFVIACLNQCGKFSPLRFRMTGEGETRECVAYAIEKETKEIIEGPPASIKLAKAEGWYQKSGSKWQTLPELMLRYRAASFFGRLYAPDLLMGMHTAEELMDVTERPARGQTVSSTNLADIARLSNAPSPEAQSEEPEFVLDQTPETSAETVRRNLGRDSISEPEYLAALKSLKLSSAPEWKLVSEGEHKTALVRWEEVQNTVLDGRDAV